MGLYDPKNPRKAPTRYAKGLVKEYTRLGVLGSRPKFETVKIPRTIIPAIGDEFATKRTTHGAVAIVPKRAGVRTFYSKKKKTLVQKAGVYSFHRYHDSGILLRGEFPTDLKSGESLAVPQGAGWKKFKNADAVAQEMGKYKPGDAGVNFWQYPYVVTRD